MSKVVTDRESSRTPASEADEGPDPSHVKAGPGEQHDLADYAGDNGSGYPPTGQKADRGS